MLSPASIAAFSKDLDRWLALSSGSIVSGPEHARAIAETAAGSEEFLARLTQGAAIADSALSRGGLDPDDIDFEAATPTERRRALRILKILSPAVSPSATLEETCAAARSARRT